MILVEGYFDVHPAVRWPASSTSWRRWARRSRRIRRHCSSASLLPPPFSTTAIRPVFARPSAPATSFCATASGSAWPRCRRARIRTRWSSREAWTRWRPVLSDAIDVLERKIQLLERKGYFEGVEHRRDAVDRLAADASARQQIRSLVSCIFRSRRSGRRQQRGAGAGTGGSAGKRESGKMRQADAANVAAARRHPVPGDGAIPRRSYLQACSPRRSSSRERERTFRQRFSRGRGIGRYTRCCSEATAHRASCRRGCRRMREPHGRI